MLYEFETCLKRGQIPLFWDKKMNMIGQLNTGLRSGMFRQILYIRIKIYTLLKSNDTSELQKYMRKHLLKTIFSTVCVFCAFSYLSTFTYIYQNAFN